MLLIEGPEAGILTLTLNRPARLNALSDASMLALDAALERAATDPAVGAVLLTGAGNRAFAAGADIGELTGATPAEGEARCLRDQAVMARFEDLNKPTLAAINGFALGGGLELATACHLRVASDTARLGLPEAKLGVLPANGGTQRLPRLVGPARALELMLTGDLIDAREAWRIGLVNHVTPAEALLDFSRALLGRMLANAPLSLAAILRSVRHGLAHGQAEGLRYEAACYAELSESEDMREGTRAFLEKRPARFTGR